MSDQHHEEGEESMTNDTMMEALIEEQRAILRYIEEKKRREQEDKRVARVHEEEFTPFASTHASMQTSGALRDGHNESDTCLTIDPNLIEEQRKILEQIEEMKQATNRRQRQVGERGAEQTTQNSRHEAAIFFDRALVEERRRLFGDFGEFNETLMIEEQRRLLLQYGNELPYQNELPGEQDESTRRRSRKDRDGKARTPLTYHFEDRVVRAGNKTLRIRGTADTYQSILRGTAFLVQCPHCETPQHVTDQEKPLYCCMCRLVSPLELARASDLPRPSSPSQSATVENGPTKEPNPIKRGHTM